MQKWCLVNAMRPQLGDLLRADSAMSVAERGPGTPGPLCRSPSPSPSPPRPQQGQEHIPTCCLMFPRVLHPSAFHTLLHTRVPLMALIILQTPALCFALGQQDGQGRAGWAARQGRRSPQHQLPQELSRMGTAPALPFPCSHPTATLSLGWSQDVPTARNRPG